MLTISEVAYTKMMLHAAKYPYCSVDGLLLGTDSHVLDAIPLFHNGTLAPMLEAARAVCEKYAASKDWRILGYYYGSEHIKDEPPRVQLGVLVQILGSRLHDPDDHALVAYDGADKLELTVEGRNAFLDALDKPIIDFDLHFHDVSNDWRNLHI